MPDPDRPGMDSLISSAGWRRHVRLIAVVLVVVLLGILLAVFIATRTSDVVDSTPATTPTVAAIATQPPAATPAAAEATYPPGSLPALLRLAPDRLRDDTTGLPIEATYADLDRWLASKGINPDTLDDAGMARLLEPLGLPEVLQTRGLTSEWRNLYGFDLRQVDQVLTVGHAPNQILIMPGSYDADTLYETWVASGYQAVEVEETTVWSLFPGDRIDLSAPASRPALGMLNTVVLLDDGTLVATARQSRMAEALRAVQGDDDSLFDNDLLRQAAVQPALVDAPCVVITSGRLLQMPAPAGTMSAAETSSGTGGTPDVSGTLPAVDLLVISLRPAGEEGVESIGLTLLYDDAPRDAERLPALIEARAVADAGWSTRYRLVAVDLMDEDGDVIDVVFSPIDDGRAILELVEDRDLEPFTWASTE